MKPNNTTTKPTENETTRQNQSKSKRATLRDKRLLRGVSDTLRYTPQQETRQGYCKVEADWHGVASTER